MEIWSFRNSHGNNQSESHSWHMNKFRVSPSKFLLGQPKDGPGHYLMWVKQPRKSESVPSFHQNYEWRSETPAQSRDQSVREMDQTKILYNTVNECTDIC